MNCYNEIKEELINNEITRKVKNYSINRSDLNTYYNVGKLLYEAGKHYGEGIIKDYSIRLLEDIGKGYSQRNLRNMRQFYKVMTKWQTVSAKIGWSHYCEIIWFNDDKLSYYINIIEKYNLSIRELRKRIKSQEYERLPKTTRDKLINKKESYLIDFVKNPIIIKNSNNIEIISEKVLQIIVLENIPSFLEELGHGFSFIKNEYKIRIGERYNYIDCLLFNIEYNCYVVIELKAVELKKEHIGQIQVYMNYLDENLKKPFQDKTIGIIICKQDNNYVIKYCSDKRIISREYILK